MIFSAEIGRRVDGRGGWFVGSCGISKPAENVIALHAGQATGERAKEMPCMVTGGSPTLASID